MSDHSETLPKRRRAPRKTTRAASPEGVEAPAVRAIIEHALHPEGAIDQDTPPEADAPAPRKPARKKRAPRKRTKAAVDAPADAAPVPTPHADGATGQSVAPGAAALAHDAALPTAASPGDDIERAAGEASVASTPDDGGGRSVGEPMAWLPEDRSGDASGAIDDDAAHAGPGREAEHREDPHGRDPQSHDGANDRPDLPSTEDDPAWAPAPPTPEDRDRTGGDTPAWSPDDRVDDAFGTGDAGRDPEHPHDPYDSYDHAPERDDRLAQRPDHGGDDPFAQAPGGPPDAIAPLLAAAGPGHHHWVYLALALFLAALAFGAWGVWSTFFADDGGSESAPALRARSEQLRQEVSTLRRSDQISRDANRDLERTLAERDEEIAGLRADIAFYESFVGATGQRRGLAVHALEMQLQGGEVWHFTATLTQNLNRGAVNGGRVTLSVEGTRNDRMERLAWSSLRKQPNAPGVAYSFKYFQQVEGEVILPAGFKPLRVAVRLVPGGGSAIEQSFPWPDTVRAGEGG